MTITKSYKFRLYPTAAQEELICRFFGAARFVYNEALAYRRKLYSETGKTAGKFDLIKRLPELKRLYPWLKDADSTALQASVENLDAAYSNFFRSLKQGKKVGYPKFKSKKSARQVYCSKSAPNIHITEKHIQLPKLGKVKCRVSKQVEGRILRATVSRNPSGKYFVSVSCADMPVVLLPKTGTAVGIDLGIKHLAVTSDEIEYPNPKYLERSQKQLVKAQRQLSRKPKESHRREKQRIKVARLHEKVRNQRQDDIHKLTTKLINSYDIICLENLAAANMLRNHRLAKAIGDAAFAEIRRQLQYKCDWYGRRLVVIDRFYPSSQVCSRCGYRNTAVKDLGIRQWTCPACGTQHDRDINAAKNILNEGLRLLM